MRSTREAPPREQLERRALSCADAHRRRPPTADWRAAGTGAAPLSTRLVCVRDATHVGGSGLFASDVPLLLFTRVTLLACNHLTRASGQERSDKCVRVYRTGLHPSARARGERESGLGSTSSRLPTAEVSSARRHVYALLRYAYAVHTLKPYGFCLGTCFFFRARKPETFSLLSIIGTGVLRQDPFVVGLILRSSRFGHDEEPAQAEALRTYGEI